MSIQFRKHFTIRNMAEKNAEIKFKTIIMPMTNRYAVP